MKELKSGEYCLAGDNKVKRIWLGCFKGWHVCVNFGWEESFKNGRCFDTHPWNICIPIPDESTYEYQWMFDNEVRNLTFYTEREIARAPYPDWTKIESTKRIRK